MQSSSSIVLRNHALVVIVAPALALAAFADPGGSLKLTFGVAKFASYNPLADVDKLAEWGFDYSEPAVTHTVELSDPDFASAAAKARASRINVEAMNWFVVGDIKLTGPAVSPARVRAYAQKALARVAARGAKVIVFGSGGGNLEGNLDTHVLWFFLGSFDDFAVRDAQRGEPWVLRAGVTSARGKKESIIPSVGASGVRSCTVSTR